MRLRVVILSVLCALLAGLVSSAGGHAQPKSAAATVRNGCTAGPLAVSRPSDTVSLTKGECYKNGQTILTIVHYSYAQSDEGGAVCGSVAGKAGRNFTPRIAGTYAVRATFTVAPKYASSGIRPRSTSATLQLGHTQLWCGKLDPANPPGFASTCDYQFSDPAYPDDTCGSVIRLPGSATYSGEYPMWSTKPRVVGSTVYVPQFVSPSGRCTQKIQISQKRGFTWMGEPVFTAYWDCSDGLNISPLVYLYYYAPGATTASCSFGEHNLNLGGEFVQFKLPNDSSNWGGTLYVVWKMLVSYKGGAYVAYAFADKTIPLAGTQNACAELSRRS